MTFRSNTYLVLRSLPRLAAGWVTAVIVVCYHIGTVSGAELITADGHAIKGEIISANNDAIIIRRSMGGIDQIESDSIIEVRIETPDDQGIVGAFSSWEDGIYGVIVDSYLVMISHDGVIKSATTIEQTAPVEIAPASSPQLEPQTIQHREPTM